MKTCIFIILLFSSLVLVRAQSEQEECFYASYDKAAKSTYKILRTDTLIQYQDELDTYPVIEISKFRSDTSVSIGGSKYRVKADTITEFVYYNYQRIDIPVISAIIDTIRDPEDTSYILTIDTINTTSVRYARIYDLNPITFFQSIEKIKSNAELQGLRTWEVVITFYNTPDSSRHLELIDEVDFEGVDFVKAIFLFEKDGEMMSYPIVFKKE